MRNNLPLSRCALAIALLSSTFSYQAFADRCFSMTEAASTVMSQDKMPLQPLFSQPQKIDTALLGSNKNSGSILNESAIPTYYVPATKKTVLWGHLPSKSTHPILTVPSDSEIIFDTLSHEGILEDQGRDPVKYFTSHGVARSMILNDAIAIAKSDIKHDFKKDGPHVVLGPVAIKDATPGDVLKIEILDVKPRVPYGVISNRHGKGALPGEYPQTPKPAANASSSHPQLYHNVSIFTPIKKDKNGRWVAVMKRKDGTEVQFPTNPFLGTMGVADNFNMKSSSVPPGRYGGNLDNNDLGRCSTLYLPVLVKGGKFFVSDPHMAQGDGEVALTALEQSDRIALRIKLLKKGSKDIPSATGTLKGPFAETPKYWMPTGLNEDLDEAMKSATRQAVSFLHGQEGMDKQSALAYLSAATNFEVTEVVDKVKSVNAKIRKSDFENHN